MKSLPRLAGLATLLVAASGCMPSGIFSTARTMPPGAIEHSVFLEAPLAEYDKAQPYESPVGQTALLVGYGLRAGLAERIEIGGHGSLTAGELNAKIGLLSTRWSAVSLAPRVAATFAVVEHAGTPLVHARLPLLATVEPTSWLAITPRAGLGIARGKVVGTFGEGQAFVSSPFAEYGLNVLFQVSKWVGLMIEGYTLDPLGDVGGRDFIAGGGGIALAFGPGRGR